MDTEALQLLIQRGETSTVEFKIAPPRTAELAERLCGFANSLGGTIIIGVADKTWEIVGVKSTAGAIDALLQAARLCKPTVPFDPPEMQIANIDGKELVLAHIPPNEGTLYQASGVFWARRGTYTVPLEVAEIESFLYSSCILSWEKQPVPRATLEDLDMELVESILEGRSEKSKNSGRLSHLDRILINNGCAVEVEEKDGQKIVRPTNAGMMLFGYYPQHFIMQAEITCILYGDRLGMRRYVDRRILHGTITEQVDQAETFFKDHIPVAGYMDGFHRRDVPDYPLDALREAVVNAVVHRDYSILGEAIRIFYYPDRIEIHNPGLLLPGISLEALQKGMVQSRLRNRTIGTVLREFPGGYMERVGSGISYMIDLMHELGSPDPQFKAQGEIAVIFSKAPYGGPWQIPSSPIPSTAAGPAKKNGIEAPNRHFSAKEERQKLALQFVHEHGSITSKQYKDLAEVSTKTAERDLEDLVERGSLRMVGKTRARYYRLP